MAVGADRPAVDHLGRLLAQLGLPVLGLEASGSDGDPDSPSAYNRRLLHQVSDDPGLVTSTAPSEIGRRLTAHRGEARERFESWRSPLGQPDVLAWADPALSLLWPFWARTLRVDPCGVLVFRQPAEGAALLVGDHGLEPDGAVAIWQRLNRAGLGLCDRSEGMVVSVQRLRSEPAPSVERLAKLLSDRGMLDAMRSLPDTVEPFEGPVAQSEVELDHATRVLASALQRLGSTPRGLTTSDGEWLADQMAALYDADYYREYDSTSHVPYSRQEETWTRYFGAVADHIVGELRPSTAIDVGCATGMLVEALRQRGVDAVGVDTSSWAIASVPAELRSFCHQARITDDLPCRFDLVVCTEVVEHLPPSMAVGAVARLCGLGDRVLFSSTPDEFAESTHLNVELPGYWAGLFAGFGFVRQFGFDASFVAPHAVLFHRQDAAAPELIEGYESDLWLARADRVRSTEAAARSEQVAGQAALRAQALEHELAEAERSYRRASAALEDERRRRRAEGIAHLDRMHAQEASQQQLLDRLGQVERRAAAAEVELEAVRRTRTFRYSQGARRLCGRLRRLRAVPGDPAAQMPSSGPVERAASAEGPRSYADWIGLYDTLDDAGRAHLRSQISRLVSPPLISVIMPVFDPREDHLRQALDSVRSQLYPRWELCVADDGSSAPWVAPLLAEAAAGDGRIKVVHRGENGHISAASNSALELATGEWVALLDHDDVLPEHALAVAALALSQHPQAGMLYSDEDTLDEEGCRRPGYFKPDFDPVLLLGQNYLAHLCLLRRTLVEQVGGWRVGLEGSQDWDLVLRVSELLRVDQVVHVPHVLYHWRMHPGSSAGRPGAKPYAAVAGGQAVADHLRRRGTPGEVVPVPRTGWNRIRWALPAEPPLVSIVVPTRDGLLLPRCLRSIDVLTTYPRYEILVVDNGSMGVDPLEYLRSIEGQVTVIRDDRDFNFSALCNEAVRRCDGQLVCLLNDDTEVITPDWLDEMVGQVLQPGVGAVGAKLLYDDGRVQHGGVLVGVDGVATHAHRLHDRLSLGYFGRLVLAQRFSAVTAACMVVRREAWEQVGGLDEEHLGVAFNDVDLCLRLGEAGWSVVWTPFAELYHHESVTRGDDQEEDRHVAEANYLKARWTEMLAADPAYNPNLSIAGEVFSLAWPPRASWRPAAP